MTLRPHGQSVNKDPGQQLPTTVAATVSYLQESSVATPGQRMLASFTGYHQGSYRRTFLTLSVLMPSIAVPAACQRDWKES